MRAQHVSVVHAGVGRSIGKERIPGVLAFDSNRRSSPAYRSSAWKILYPTPCWVTVGVDSRRPRCAHDLPDQGVIRQRQIERHSSPWTRNKRNTEIYVQVLIVDRVEPTAAK